MFDLINSAARGVSLITKLFDTVKNLSSGLFRRYITAGMIQCKPRSAIPNEIGSLQLPREARHFAIIFIAWIFSLFVGGLKNVIREGVGRSVSNSTMLFDSIVMCLSLYSHFIIRFATLLITCSSGSSSVGRKILTFLYASDCLSDIPKCQGPKS